MSVTDTFRHRRHDLSVVRLDAADGDEQAVALRSERFVLRRVDPWSVFKVSLVFYLCVCGVLLVAGVLLWLAAAGTGVVDNVEGFMQSAGFEAFHFRPAELFRAFTLIGLILVVAGTFANVLLVALFNVISETVGGVRVSLLEDRSSTAGR